MYRPIVSRWRRPRRPALSAGALPQIEPLEDRLLLSLLGVGAEILPPDVFYDSTGQIAYDVTAQLLSSDAAPTGIAFIQGQRPFRVVAAPGSPLDFRLGIRVDSQGDVLGGVEGDDLWISGAVDVNRDGVYDYSGTLLTGEIVAFGYLDVGITDQYDFRFHPTGGSLMSFFEGKDIGMTTTSVNSSFAGSFAVDFSGGSQGVLGVIDRLSSLAGRVFVDVNGDGQADPEEPGIADVPLTLTGTDNRGNAVSLLALTGADGSYCFADVRTGQYVVAAAQPAEYLDGEETVGSAGGAAGDDSIAVTLGPGVDAEGYNFGEIPPGMLSGLVYEDFNDDGEVDFNDHAIVNVAVTLTGVDDRGQAVSQVAYSDADGEYFFGDLRPGTYAIAAEQPEGYPDGRETIGTLGGTTGNDIFENIVLPAGEHGADYNFAERPAEGTAVTRGQTATIGFWQNKNGQALLKALNGGETATQLGNWLALSFPTLYGAAAGDNDLTGKTNADVAAFYREKLFNAKKAKGDVGPAKVEAQVMATAFAVYVTNAALAGTTASAYGFLVTADGVGVATFNVGDAGAAFGVADGSVMTVLNLLLATDDAAVDGRIYTLDAVLRSLTNQVYTAINESGDIG